MGLINTKNKTGNTSSTNTFPLVNFQNKTANTNQIGIIMKYPFQLKRKFIIDVINSMYFRIRKFEHSDYSLHRIFYYHPLDILQSDISSQISFFLSLF